MRKPLLFAAVLLFMAAPAFAVGNLTVFSLPLSPMAAYANTNQSVNALNLSLNVTAGSGGDGLVNITSINVTFNASSEGGIGNISAVEIRNSTGSVIGRNATINNATNITFTVFIPGGLTVSASNATILVAINISRSATRQLNISANITSSADIGTNSSLNNISLSGTSIRSNGIQIQDLHANATISPRFVDTGVINQSFMYIMAPTGADLIKSINITFPANYSLVAFTSILVGTGVPDGATNSTAANGINITLGTGTTQPVQVNFTANTSSSGVVSRAFLSAIDGANLSAALPETAPETINVTTQATLNLSTVIINKGTAIVNGTDFWEFNFTLNYTANISTGGIIQFRLTNWNTTSSSTINITDALCPGSRCATLRNDTNFSSGNGKINITNDYESLTKGVAVSSTSQGSLMTLVLRMIIPSGTAITSNWQAAYGFLFRASP